MLDDQPFALPRKKTKEKELRKHSFENLISPNRLELLSWYKNENENLDHREKYKPFNQIDFKVTQPSVSAKSSLNSNGSIVKTPNVGNLNKNCYRTGFDSIVWFTNDKLPSGYLPRETYFMFQNKQLSRFCFCHWTRTCFEWISQTKRNRASGKTFSYR